MADKDVDEGWQEDAVYENLFAIFTVVILYNVINDVIVGGACGRW